MKRALLVACFSLFMLVGAVAPAHAGTRIFFGFGIGFGGFYHPAYRPFYPYVYAPYSYGYYPPCGWYSPYAVRPWVGYYRAPYYAPYYSPYRAYTLRLPSYRVARAVVHGRVYAPPVRNVGTRNYGSYAPRRYVRR